MALEGPFFGVFSARKVDKRTRKSRFFLKFYAFREGDFDKFKGQETVFKKWLATAARERVLSVCASETNTKGTRAT